MDAAHLTGLPYQQLLQLRTRAEHFTNMAASHYSRHLLYATPDDSRRTDNNRIELIATLRAELEIIAEIHRRQAAELDLMDIRMALILLEVPFTVHGDKIYINGSLPV